MSGNQTHIANDLIDFAAQIDVIFDNTKDGHLRRLLERTALAVEELVAIAQQIAPSGTDARLDAWCKQYLNHNQMKECPSDPDYEHHIAHI